MKSKNFLRNLSTTALAMCCLSSAIAFPSFASFEENNEENLGNIAWLFEEEEKEAVDLPSSASSNKGPKLTLTKSFETKTSFPVIDDEGNLVYKGDSYCTVTFESDSIWSSSMAVTGSTENNNGIVFIPQKFPSGINGNTVEVTKINPDATFFNTKTLVFPDEAECNKAEIRKNNPDISILYKY